MTGETKPRCAAQKIVSTVLACGVFATAQSGASFAYSGTQDEQSACTPDVFRLCLFDIPNETRIVDCLNRNLGQLSPACHDVIAGPDAKDKDKDKPKR